MYSVAPAPTVDTSFRQRLSYAYGLIASLGARLFSPKYLWTQVGYTVRQGHDFPLQTSRLLETWGITLSIIQEDDRLSTRGELCYLDQSLASKSNLTSFHVARNLTRFHYLDKSFRYLTPTLFIEPTHLDCTNLLGSRCFHFFLDPTEIIDQTAQLLELREESGITEPPFIVWEPRAYACTPGYLRNIIEALRVVDVFSPNHIELAQTVGMDVPAMPDKDAFERLCAPLMVERSGPGAREILVTRAGAMGCFVKTETQSVLLPAYHSPSKDATADIASKVVDTTGAGNAFLGAFAMGLMQSSGDVIHAACAGNVGASFAVEQVGVPALTISEDREELWNGEEVSTRMQVYKTRLGVSSQST